MSAEPTVNCDGCGATIFPEHLRSRLADRWAGKLLCPHCLNEKKGAATTPPPPPVALAPEPPPLPAETPPTARVSSAPPPAREPNWKRSLGGEAGLATRSRTFHAKLSEAALSHLNAQINEWVDGHSDVKIKFATSSIGVFEGKHSEQHLVITIFY